jgi:hypothetical protein
MFLIDVIFMVQVVRNSEKPLYETNSRSILSIFLLRTNDTHEFERPIFRPDVSKWDNANDRAISRMNREIKSPVRNITRKFRGIESLLGTLQDCDLDLRFSFLFSVGDRRIVSRAQENAIVNYGPSMEQSNISRGMRMWSNCQYWKHVLKLQREKKDWTLAQRDAYRLDDFTIPK